jgi:hypothetical protein
MQREQRRRRSTRGTGRRTERAADPTQGQVARQRSTEAARAVARAAAVLGAIERVVTTD